MGIREFEEHVREVHNHSSSSIKEQWEKQEKVVTTDRGEEATLTLYRHKGQIMGMEVSAPFSSDLSNECWTEEGCRAMIEAREMISYDEDDCPTSTQVQKLFNEGSVDF